MGKGGIAKMSTSSSDAAEQVVKIYLDGVEVALKISGVASKNIVAALYAIMQDKNKTKVKIRLTSMLKTGKELKIFSIKREDLKKFSEEAKRYGVLYCALAKSESKNRDGMVDIMVRAEDALKINRIVERFNLNALSGADVKNEIENSKGNDGQSLDKGVQVKSKEDLLVEDILSKPISKEENETNPSISQSEKYQSEPSLNSKDSSEEIIQNIKKPSVKQRLKNIKAELEAKEIADEPSEIVNELLTPKHIKQKYDKENAKHIKQGAEPRHMKNAKHFKNSKSNMGRGK